MELTGRLLDLCREVAAAENLDAMRRAVLRGLAILADVESGYLYGPNQIGNAFVCLASVPALLEGQAFPLGPLPGGACAISGLLRVTQATILGPGEGADALRETLFGVAAGQVLAIPGRIGTGAWSVIALLLLQEERVVPPASLVLLDRFMAFAGAGMERTLRVDCLDAASHRLEAEPGRDTAGHARGNMERRLIGVSPSMQRLREQIARVASRDISVLILGETGTGKELIARELHELSNRKDHPFVALNVASLPENLVEDELFGHVKGAFTGAHAARTGLIAAARGGTLFLDEIGDMAPALQAKLLRVLQERRYRPVGADREESADIRLVAATHADLPHMAADGRFRSDLFFRIAQIRIVSPPLRERNGDIMLLAHHFLATNSAQFGGAKVFALTAEALLAGYAYPGNVRELQAIVERAVLLSGERAMIEAEDLALVAPAKSPEFDVSGFALPKACDRFEASLITRALEQRRGSRRLAAEDLGIPLRTLSNKMRKLGLDGPEAGENA